MTDQAIPDLAELDTPADEDVLAIAQISTGITKKVQASRLRSKQTDLVNYGDTFATAINAAIAAGITEVYISRDYTVPVTGTAVFTIPAAGISLLSENGATLTFTGDGILASCGDTANIEINGLRFYTNGTDRGTIISFTSIASVTKLVINGCDFEGKTRLLWNNDGSTDPSGTSWGVTECFVTNNRFKDHNSRFINFTNVPTEHAEFSDNKARNMGSTLFYWTRGGTFQNEIGLLHEKLVFNRNEVINDDDYWADSPEGSYISPVVLQGHTCSVGWNVVEGLKSRSDSKDFQPFYMSCLNVHCHNNRVKNCGTNATTIGDAVIFHCKGHPGNPTTPGNALFEDNSYVQDRNYFSDMSEAEPTWQLMKSSVRHFRAYRNTVDIPKLETAGDGNSASVFQSLDIDGLKLTVWDELLSSSVMRIEQNTDDATQRFRIANWEASIAGHSTVSTASLVRVTSTHTRGDGDSYMPSTLEFYNNTVKMLDNKWEHVFESGGPWVMLDGQKNVIEWPDGDSIFSSSILGKTFQLKVNYLAGATASNILPTSDSFFYDTDADIDIEVIGSTNTNRLYLPTDTGIFGATTARMSVDCEVKQTDGDHCRGVFDALFQDDGAGNLDMLFDVSSSEVTAQIPDTTEQNGSNMDVTNSLTHGNDLFAAVALTNNTSPNPAYFTLPIGYQVRLRIIKRDL